MRQQQPGEIKGPASETAGIKSYAIDPSGDRDGATVEGCRGNIPDTRLADIQSEWIDKALTGQDHGRNPARNQG